MGDERGAGEPARRWFALYTRSRHEKDILQDLEPLALEAYLPVVARERRWKDRRKLVEFPLFPGYVFLRCDFDAEEGWALKREILKIKGAVRILSSKGGAPIPIPDQEIFNIRTVLEQKMRVDPYHEEFAPGQTLRIRKGPLAGVEGILLVRRGIFQLILQVQLLNQAVAVTLSVSDVEKMG